MTRAEDDSQETEVPIPLPAWVPVNECSRVFMFTRLLLHMYTIVVWTSQCNVTPVLVTKPLLRLIHAVSCCQWKRRYILCHLCGALSVSLYVKHQTRPLLPGHVSRSVCFTCCSQALQCTGQCVQWSVKVTRPCMQCIGLQPARYIEAATCRAISRYETPRYID